MREAVRMVTNDFRLLIEKKEIGKFAVVINHSDGVEEQLRRL